MEKFDCKNLNIKLHNIVFAETSLPDYEMSRSILLETDDGFVIVEGYHCSCYDFNETEWEAMKYTEKELKKLAMADYNRGSKFWQMINRYLKY